MCDILVNKLFEIIGLITENEQGALDFEKNKAIRL